MTMKTATTIDVAAPLKQSNYIISMQVYDRNALKLKRLNTHRHTVHFNFDNYRQIFCLFDFNKKN